MVEAFAMIAGTALEYGDRTLACLDGAQTEAKNSKSFLLVYLASEHKFTGCCFLPKGRGLTKMCQLRQSVCFFFFNLLKDSFF